MHISQAKYIISMIVTFVCMMPYLASSATMLKYDFESPDHLKQCKGWSLVPQKIKIADDNGNKVLHLTVGKGWNTAIIAIKPPVTITATTVLRFKIKTSRPGGWEVNLRNISEEAEYAMLFRVAKQDEWTTIQLMLKDACYKRSGKAGIEPNGMIGDKLGSVQIAFRGKKCLIDDFEIINLKKSDLKSLVLDNRFIIEYKKMHKPRNYSQLARNGIFPFGVIITLNADRNNARFFGQTSLNRYKNSLLELKQNGFNTISNFCNNFDDDLTLKLMKKYHLYLLATSTCGRKLYSFPEDNKVLKSIKKNSHHPNLLAWYGQDEPTDIEFYLKNKKRIETLAAGGAPCTSAMHMNSVVKSLSPCMDVIIIDPYTLTAESNLISSSRILSKHRVNVRLAKACMGKRVWVIPQAFGMRSGGSRTLRYPEPVEVRFNAFNVLAAGAGGLIYFIYEDTVPYLDKQIRGEEFDQTLVDAWGNKNATYDELIEIGSRLTPIMPSFLDVKKGTKLKINCANKNIFISQWENELGTLIFCVNSDLSREADVKVSFNLPKKTKIYNLETLKSVDGSSVSLKVKPGDGRLFLVANKKNFAQAAMEIKSRKSIARWELLDVKLNELKKAGFNTQKISRKLARIKPVAKRTSKIIPEEILNEIDFEISSLRKSNSTYCDVANNLERIKKIFGKINAALVAPGVIEKVDKNPQWYNIFNLIKKSGKEYFSLRRNWSDGKYDAPLKQLPKLENTVSNLEKEVYLKLKANNLKPIW